MPRALMTLRFRRTISIPRIILLLLPALLTASCAVVRSTKESGGDKVIIFVPGFKGSVLTDQDGDTAWLTLSNVLFRRTSVALPNPQMEISGEELKSGGILKSLTILPGIYRHDFYRSFLSELRAAERDSEIYEFHYDWRLGVESAARELDKVVAARRAAGARSINLVGHSMGGLIVGYYLRFGGKTYREAALSSSDWRGAQSVERAVIAGAPFSGAFEMFHDLVFGEETGPNRALLSAEALATFTSSYELLPSPRTGFFSSSNDPDLFDAVLWRKHGWGLFSQDDSISNSALDERLTFTEERLALAKAFKDLLHRPSAAAAPESLRILNVIGSGLTTKSALPWDGEGDLTSFEYAGDETGDGLVTLLSATLPRPFQKAVKNVEILIEVEHGDLLNHPASRDEVFKFLAGSMK